MLKNIPKQILTNKQWNAYIKSQNGIKHNVSKFEKCIFNMK